MGAEPYPQHARRTKRSDQNLRVNRLREWLKRMVASGSLRSLGRARERYETIPKAVTGDRTGSV
jgi:hypothetical protein